MLTSLLFVAENEFLTSKRFVVGVVIYLVCDISKIKMAAPMDRVRIRLKFENVKLQKSWLLIDFNNCKNVRDIANVIKRRFEIKKPVELWLQKYHLHPEESAFIIRDDDTVIVR